MRHSSLLHLLLIASPLCAFAQDVKIIDSLPIQTIHSQRIAIKAETNTQELISLSKIDLDRLSPITTAEAIRLSGSANMQQSQVGGGSPILRGFEANRVLLVIDGVRMNNAIYRAGHLQSIISVDPSILESIEILNGPASVSYGSDALGGVIIMNTLNPRFQINGKAFIKPSASVRYGSAGHEQSYHAQVEAGLGSTPLAFLTSVTYTDRENLRTGSWHPDGNYSWGRDLWNISRTSSGKDTIVANSDPLVQDPSGYHQLDLLQKFRYSHSETVELNANFQYSTTGDIPRYDRMTEIDDKGKPVYAEWYYGPQDRLLASLGFKHNPTAFALYDQSELLLSWQSLGESRMSRKLNKATLKHQVEDVQAYRLNWDFSKSILVNTLRYGIDFGYDDVDSKAWQDSVQGGGLGAMVDTRYPKNGSQLAQYGIYLGDLWQIHSDLHFDLGLRYQGQYLQADFGDTTALHLPFQKVDASTGALTGSTGLSWNAYKGIKVGVLANTGFRSPNVDDLGKVFDSQFDTKKGTATLIIPNENLNPEYAWNGEVFAQFNFGKFLGLDLRAHQTYLEDALALAPTTLNGQSKFKYEGITTTPLSLQNLNQALIRGWSATTHAKFSQLEIKAGANQSFGEIDDGSERPMDHIAPFAWNASMAWNADLYELQLGSIGSGAKAKEDYNLLGEDNFVYATADGLPSWWILNSRISLKFRDKVRLNLGVENIFDHYYRTFASGTGAPGRNFVLSLNAGI